MLLLTKDHKPHFNGSVDIAAEKGITLTVDQVKGFLKQNG